MKEIITAEWLNKQWFLIVPDGSDLFEHFASAINNHPDILQLQEEKSIHNSDASKLREMLVELQEERDAGDRLIKTLERLLQISEEKLKVAKEAIEMYLNWGEKTGSDRYLLDSNFQEALKKLEDNNDL